MVFKIEDTLQELKEYQTEHSVDFVFLGFFCNNRRQPKAFSFQVVLDDGNVVNYMSSLKSEYGLDEGVNYRRTPIICSRWKLEVVVHAYNSLISIAAPFVYWKELRFTFPTVAILAVSS